MEQEAEVVARALVVRSATSSLVAIPRVPFSAASSDQCGWLYREGRNLVVCGQPTGKVRPGARTTTSALSPRSAAPPATRAAPYKRLLAEQLITLIDVRMISLPRHPGCRSSVSSPAGPKTRVTLGYSGAPRQTVAGP